MNAEQAKFLVGYFANMMEMEAKTTAKVLAAVPDDRRDYRPDEKSRTAWELATHLATSDVWFLDSIIKGAFEWNPDAAKQAESRLATVNDVVELYSSAFPERIKALRALPGEKLAETIEFFGMMKMPRAQFVAFANNHSIHHRGQLAAYLRALGAKVPNIYGPSADAEPNPSKDR